MEQYALTGSYSLEVGVVFAFGRQAQIEKKMARREAAKERDASPDIVKLPGGGDVMGGDDSLEAARARHVFLVCIFVCYILFPARYMQAHFQYTSELQCCTTLVSMTHIDFVRKTDLHSCTGVAAA